MEENSGRSYTKVIFFFFSSNGLGVAGFVFAILGLLLFWIPILGWIIWFLGGLFSFIGLFKAPRGLAIAGFILSFIDLILILAGAALFAAMLAF